MSMRALIWGKTRIAKELGIDPRALTRAMGEKGNPLARLVSDLPIPTSVRRRCFAFRDEIEAFVGARAEGLSDDRALSRALGVRRRARRHLETGGAAQ